MFYVTDENGNPIPIAGTGANPNLDCLRTKILWTNPSPTTSFDTSTTISLGSENYSYLLIEYMAYPTIYASMIVPFKEGDGSIYYSLSDTSTSNTTYFVQLGQRKFTIDSSNQITFGDGYWVNHSEKLLLNDYMIPVKITGIIKSPAMIYTGAELFEGSGIKINNGTISALLKGVMCRQTNTDQSISSSFINIKYNRLVSSIGSGVTYSNGNFVVGEGITCIKFIIDCNFYNMTGVSYFRVLPKKNGTLTGDELWYFFDSGHSGGFSQTIMLPCQSGDSFTLDGIIAANYSGYLNSNSYITVEVF